MREPEVSNKWQTKAQLNKLTVIMGCFRLERGFWVPIHAVTRDHTHKDGDRFRVALDFAPAK